MHTKETVGVPTYKVFTQSVPALSSSSISSLSEWSVPPPLRVLDSLDRLDRLDGREMLRCPK